MRVRFAAGFRNSVSAGKLGFGPGLDALLTYATALDKMAGLDIQQKQLKSSVFGHIGHMSDLYL